MFVERLPQSGILAYIQAMQPLHERLRQILTQAAGYSLLVMTRVKRLAFLDSPVTSAREALAMARAGIDRLQVPAAARHHHHHITAASEAIAQALDLLLACLRPSADDPARADLTRMLRIATDHLRATTHLLPGFVMVNLSQACCAAHASQASMLICQTVEG